MKRLALLLVLLAACESGTEPRTLDGRWQLLSVDGKPLPAQFHTQPQEPYEIVVGALLIAGSGYERSIERRGVLSNTTGTIVDRGSLIVTGTSATFKSLNPSWPDMEAVWTGNRLEYSEPDSHQRLEFRRR